MEVIASKFKIMPIYRFFYMYYKLKSLTYWPSIDGNAEWHNKILHVYERLIILFWSISPKLFSVSGSMKILHLK